ncbi:MAG: MFS transporter [Micromonosporaceae bacterium]|nr:MFS transporter [Micromonosporaceae bacterium]
MLRSDAAPASVTPARRRVAIGAGAAAVLLASLDAYVVVTLFVDMARDMHVAVNRLEQATPVVTGFLLGYVAGMPLLGGLSDKMGRRAVTQICLGGFLVGSMVTAASIEIGEYLDMEPLPVLVAGRVIQGLAGGALLPVSMALVADLWTEERRPAVLGTVGAAQELGSVLGPLYGGALGAIIGWQGIFWINVPLVLIAMVAVQAALPGRAALGLTGPRPKVDLVGGLLLALSLGLLTVGLNNQKPEESILPPYGPPLIIAGVAVLVVFLIWESIARTKLVDLSGAPKLPFFAVLIASLLAGAALLVTLLDIVLLAQGVLGITDPRESAKLLVYFLAALPVGAVIGGLIAGKFGLRGVTVVGFLISAGAYWLVSTWPASILTERHELLGLSLPRMNTDLALAGLGLGLVIAPLSAAVLRIVPPSQHGVASAGVVVARTIGMLVGFAALTGWGLHRFHTGTRDLKFPELDDLLNPTPEDLAAIAQYEAQLRDYLMGMYRDIFLATAACCLVAAVVSLAITRRRPAPQPAVEHTEAPATV